ncbi:EpsG family protein [Clostridium perfringens]
MIVYSMLLFTVCSIIALIEGKSNKLNSINGNNERSRKLDRHRISFVVTFFILSTFSAIRDGVGCDYESYVLHILNIQSGNKSYMEEGFQKVVIWASKIDQNPRLVIIIFAILTCFFYIKAIWDQSTNRLFSVFIFLSWGYYFLTFNTIRNYFALAVVLYSIKFLDKNKYIKFIFFVIVASFFHKSALVCIPIYLLAKRKYSIKYVPFIILITVLAILLKEYLREFLFIFYPGYMGSAYDVGHVSYLNIIKAVLVIILCAINYKNIKNDSLSRFFFNLNVLSLVFYIGFYWTPEISRIGFYMNATSIFLIPRVIDNFKKIKSKTIVYSVVIVFSIILFFLLMNQFQEITTRLLPYKTWIFNGTY